MSGLSQIDQVLLAAAVTSKLGAVADSLNRCFDTTFKLEAAELQAYSESPPGMDLLQPGVIVSLWVGDEALLCAIPESLPLPSWYTQPDAAQQLRLDNLSMEWAAACLPDEMPGETFTSDIVPAIWDSICACEVSQEATWLPIDVKAATDESTVNSRIWFLWPSTTSPRNLSPAWTDDSFAGDEPGLAPEFDSATLVEEPAFATQMTGSSEVALDAKLLARRQLLLSIPISVIVKLAEKKIELGQLMVMGPGTIVTFEKSCEDLLDLYVNNQLYCRGEAVKIGEKFGIKVNEVGSVEERVSAVLGWNA